MADSAIEEAVRSSGIEIFGNLELILNASNKSGYKDVYPLQRKKRPWQAKVWDAARQSHVSLGSFGTPREAAVAVATARTAGLENLPSPDKSRAARGSGAERAGGNARSGLYVKFCVKKINVAQPRSVRLRPWSRSQPRAKVRIQSTTSS